MKKALIFGSNGLLGQSLVQKFSSDFQIIGASIEADNNIKKYGLKLR